MHLVQQYVMLSGKLQPALKYQHANPMYNRYKLENAQSRKVKEMITLPTLAGDIAFQNDYVGGQAKNVASPRVDVARGGESKLESYLADLQDANRSQAKRAPHKPGGQGSRRVTTLGGSVFMDEDADPDAGHGDLSDQSEDIEDPRTLQDVEQENMELKEQLATQLLSVEQYLGVAQLWLIERQGGAESALEFEQNAKVQASASAIGATMAEENPQAASVPSLPGVWHNYPNQSELDYKTEHPPSIYSSLRVEENNYRDDRSQAPSKKSSASRRSYQAGSIPEQVSLAGVKIKELFFKKH